MVESATQSPKLSEMETSRLLNATSLHPEQPQVQDAQVQDALPLISDHTGELQTWHDFLKGCWVLFVYSLFSGVQCMLWLVPGPLSSTLLEVYPRWISGFDVQLFLSECAGNVGVPARQLACY